MGPISSPAGPAVAADSVEVDFESIDGGIAQLGLSLVDPVLGMAEVDIEDASAPAADEMVVVVGGGIILSRTSGSLQGGNQSGFDQFLEIPMDGCLRDRRKDTLDMAVKIVCRRMGGRLAQGS